MTIGNSQYEELGKLPPPICIGPNRNVCGEMDMTGGTRCKLPLEHDGDHDYRFLERRELYACKGCGSVVNDQERHDQWHQEIRCSCTHGLIDEFCAIHGDVKL
jgi:hypothetical protein